MKKVKGEMQKVWSMRKVNVEDESWKLNVEGGRWKMVGEYGHTSKNWQYFIQDLETVREN